MADSADKPGIIAPPPLIYGGGFLIALFLHWRQPLTIFGRSSALWPGLGLIALGLGLGIWGGRTLAAAGTNVNPYRPSTMIVDSGPFGFSRNPLYVGMTLVYTGLTLAFDTWWGFLLLPAVLIVMHLGVIRREERYLDNKFGDNYRRYRNRVRRYL